MKVGVLALQGAFIEHERRFGEFGCEVFEIRQLSHLPNSFDALVLPGGESTAQSKLLHELGLFAPLKEAILSGVKTLGTCAGAILLAKQIQNSQTAHFATLDVEILRNAYGRQLGSFHTISEFKGLGKVPMTFIRAPIFTAVGEGVEILSEVEGRVVAVRNATQLALSFHPELDANNAIFEYFIKAM